MTHTVRNSISALFPTSQRPSAHGLADIASTNVSRIRAAASGLSDDSWFSSSDSLQVPIRGDSDQKFVVDVGVNDEFGVC